MDAQDEKVVRSSALRLQLQFKKKQPRIVKEKGAHVRKKKARMCGKSEFTRMVRLKNVK